MSKNVISLWQLVIATYNNGKPISAPVYIGEFPFKNDIHDWYLQRLVEKNPDDIFYLTTESTDVWPEWELERN